ncbi:hypothetical protein AMEX_G24982, partial [Astyanax mexicanus]
SLFLFCFCFLQVTGAGEGHRHPAVKHGVSEQSPPPGGHGLFFGQCRKAWVKHILCVPTSRPQPAAIIPGPAAQALADPVWEVEDLDDEVEMSKEESDVSSVSSSSFFSEDSDVYTSPFSSCSESSVEDLTTTVFPPELTGQGVTAPSPTIRTQSRSLKILTTNFWTSVFSRFRSRARVSVLVGEADPGLEAEPAAQDVQDLEERRDAVETPPKRKVRVQFNLKQHTKHIPL